ncbi:MAG: sigma-70 family RNA polymerase sigma factor [Oscillospiraceae bacterium]|nr:sigma-70 family RNA polymerase sigma factor [Oscillospiraceae bacterium]
MTEEQKLLAGLKKRRHGSLEKVIDLYTPYVTVIVYNVVGAAMPKEDIEEVVSDSFLSLWKSAGTLNSEKGSIRTYLAAIARNRAKNKLRTIHTHEEISENIISAYKTPQEDVEEQEKRSLMLELIKSLGEPDCEIFLRYYYYEEKISKIADITGLHVSTVKTKLSRGRKKIKESLINKEVRQ